MKNSVDFTRGHQFGYMLLRHLISVLLCFIIQFVFLIKLFEHNTIRIILGCLFSLIYGSAIYTGASKMGLNDAKSYTKMTVKPSYSMLWGISIAVINILAFLVCNSLGAWDLTYSIVSQIVRFLSYILFSPYLTLFINASAMPLYVIVMMVVIPILFSYLGYIAGSKRFSILEKIQSLTFEKD